MTLSASYAAFSHSYSAFLHPMQTKMNSHHFDRHRDKNFMSIADIQNNQEFEPLSSHSCELSAHNLPAYVQNSAQKPGPKKKKKFSIPQHIFNTSEAAEAPTGEIISTSTCAT